MRFRTADEAVAFYAATREALSAPQGANDFAGLAWAEACVNAPRCGSRTAYVTYGTRRKAPKAKCIRCHAEWRDVSVWMPRARRARETMRKRAPAESDLLEVATIGAMLARLPRFQRLALVSYVLFPGRGQRYQALALEFRQRFPWRRVRRDVLAACPGSAAPHAVARQLASRGWNEKRVRKLVKAARRALEAQLEDARMLAA